MIGREWLSSNDPIKMFEFLSENVKTSPFLGRHFGGTARFICSLCFYDWYDKGICSLEELRKRREAGIDPFDLTERESKP